MLKEMTNDMPAKLNRRDFLRITAFSSAALMASCNMKNVFPPVVRSVKETHVLMGTILNFHLVTTDESAGRRALRAAMREMLALVAIFDHRKPQSQLARLNAGGELTDPAPHLVELLQISKRFGELTQGAFDVTIKPVLDAFASGRNPETELRAAVDFSALHVADDRIRLQKPGMSITLDGIAKGRVVDAGLAALKSHGFNDLLIEAGGDLICQGLAEGDQPWQIAIMHPRQDPQSKYLGKFAIRSMAVATSGDYMCYFRQDFSANHILDPITGCSPEELASVTILAPSATIADAISTAVMVMGQNRGLAFVEGLDDSEALLVSKDMHIMHTAGFPVLQPA